MKLKDVCFKITDGSHNPPAGSNTSKYLMLSSKNIFDDRITLEEPRYLTEEEFNKENQRTQIQQDDLLMTIVGTVGRVAVVGKELHNICLQRSVAVLKPDKEKVNPRFLMYYIKSMQQMLEKESRGVAQKGLYLKQIAELPIKIPSLEMQLQITNEIDSVSELLNKRKQQLRKLDELVKARFVEMFGDPITNSKNMDELPLNALGELGRGISKHRPRNAPELLGGKYPLIQTGDVANAELYIEDFNNTYSELGLKQSKMWKAGTLCITIAANIAKTAILKFDACFPDSVVGFNANSKTNNVFMHYWFTFFQSILEAQAPESAQKNINLKILSELNVIVPPIELQSEFVEFVNQIDKSKLDVQKSLDKLETLKKALMQKYFG